MTIANANPFQTRGNSVRIAAPTAAPPTGVQVPQLTADQGSLPTQFRVRNTSLTNDVALGWGATAALAAANAVFPIAAGASQQCVTMGPGQTEVLTFPPSTFFSGLSVGSASNIDITPGEGP